VPRRADGRYELVVIDEFGVWPRDRLAAIAFFTLISTRYERGSVVLTSKRLLHNSHVLNIRGDSYRLREKKRAGLIGVGATPHGRHHSGRRGH
jgi:DNA replication protein DnaC